MNTRFKVFLGLLLFFLFSLSASMVSAADTYAAPYDALLHQYVHQGTKVGITANLVDYGAWAQDQRHAQAMDALVKTDPFKLSSAEAKVFWINTYNLLTIDLIVKNPDIESIKDLGTLLQSPWKAHSWEIAGKKYTLDDIEHGILRKMKDPRIHMAIVCASLSCPDIRNEAYQTKTLDSQLDDQARKFLVNSTKGLKGTPSGLMLSPIFKWFSEDFGGEKGVLVFVRKYGSISSDDKNINDYFDYDWSLNKP